MARAPVGGVSGARIRSRQACARGEGLAGVRRPCGGKALGSAAALTGDAKKLSHSDVAPSSSANFLHIFELRASFCEPQSCRGVLGSTTFVKGIWSTSF